FKPICFFVPIGELTMKRVATWGLSLAVLCLAAGARAEELRSGPQPGEMLGAYEVTKVAGAPEDDVPVGQQLWYCCKMRYRPVVFVFSRKRDRALARLVKRRDTFVAQNKEDHNMASFVSLVGDKPEDLATEGKKIVEDTNVKNVAFVVPKEQPNG